MSLGVQGGTGDEGMTPARAKPAPSSTAAPSVSLRGLTKRFGDFAAVRDMDLNMPRGHFFTMLGPSGCGKTTTLRMIAGFEEPSEGTVLLDGEDVTGLPPFKRPTNTVFQSYALFPHLSVEDNVAFGLRRQGVARDEVTTRVADELERVGLSEAAKRKPAQLAGGQPQRVPLPRALVTRPALLLLDEPLGALDLKLRKQLQVELKGIQRDVGITFVYVTHDQEEALTMSDRIAVMNRGVIEQVDVPEAVYERPRTTFVAGFIGVSNLMPGEVAQSGELRLDAGLTIPLATNGAEPGERLHCVVRPEKLELHPQGDGLPPGRLAVKGVIESSLYLGTATQVVVRLHDTTAMTVLIPNADDAARQRLPGPGSPVQLAWSPD